MGRFRTAVIGGALLAACVHTVAQPEPDFYFVGRERVTLTPSSTYVALRIAPGASMESFAALSNDVDAAGGEVLSSPLLERYGLVLVRKKEDVGPSSFAESMRTFSTTTPNLAGESPVYVIDGVEHALTEKFITQFRAGTDEATIGSTLQDFGAEVVAKNEKVPGQYTVRFRGVSPREALSKSNELHRNAVVEYSEPNFVRILPARPEIRDPEPGDIGRAQPGPLEAPDDPLFPNQWALSNRGGAVGAVDADIDGPQAWDVEKGSATIVVAIIDEGVDTAHPDLVDKIVTPYDATDGDNDQEPNPWDGHGTACAGIAAAVTRNARGVAGVGWNVKVLPVRIASSNCNGCDWVTSSSIIADGIRTAVDRGAHVLSNSWGGGGSSNAINAAIDYAVANNRVVVFAAGNDSGPVSYPGNRSGVSDIITVSATNEWDEFKTRTSRDNEDWWGSNFGPQVSVSAPGVHMYTTDISGANGYASGDYVATFNGTSSATPVVAGLAALLVSQNPAWTSAQVRDRIQQTAQDLGSPEFDAQFGHGRVNACRAVGGAGCDDDGATDDDGICGALTIVQPSGAQGAFAYLFLLSLPFVLLVLWRRMLRSAERTTS